jgi:hypothetical protein
MENILDTQPIESGMHNPTLFLRLMLVLADQRSKAGGGSRELAVASLTSDAIVAAMDDVVNRTPPLCCRPMVLGPLLHMFLTLTARKIFSQPAELQSSIVPARSRECTG